MGDEVKGVEGVEGWVVESTLLGGVRGGVHGFRCGAGVGMGDRGCGWERTWKESSDGKRAGWRLRRCADAACW